MTTLKNGLLLDSKVIDKVFGALHRGPLKDIHAIVVHQTDSSTAQQTFNKYAGTRPTGAHFLIDKQGQIFQTALLTQKCAHIGKILSKCYEMKGCTKAEYNTAHSIYHQKGLKFSVRVNNLYQHEKVKSYPNRYPLNEDAIGIEIVGRAKKIAGQNHKIYEPVNVIQNASLKWLINTLYSFLNLTDDDVYRHPEISRKNQTEASTGKW